MKKITLSISGMHCTSCAFNIDGELEDTNGVTESNTNFAKQSAEVMFDDSKISEDDILNIISSLGYTASVT